MNNLFASWFVNKTVEKQTLPGRNKNIRTKEVNRGSKFLSLPEVLQIDANHTKAKFLKSRGLHDDEVAEAFKQTYLNRNNNNSASSVLLHAVSNNGIQDQKIEPVMAINQQRNTFSAFFTLCQKLAIFIGFTSSCFYLYQKWLQMKQVIDRSKKEEQHIRQELNQIKNELTKIATELRLHQSIERNQANLLSEINSLKAILVSRQYFEEKETATFSLPSWQLASNDSKSEITLESNSSSSIAVKEEEEASAGVASLPSQLNGYSDEIKSKSVTSESAVNFGNSDAEAENSVHLPSADEQKINTAGKMRYAQERKKGSRKK